eukprot:gnl/MRDRNA2_/MRDRNA2_120937_c0_seq1.p1 gnl/MRDRNA2_/MRDRNA2_120937_c0~~gnl/MRDRNA2_/MRDRNA2_120937_c0_seq1.p1  ORF type:complete len:144 (-),score=25.14 gnl/MRDRNA2_/MRDRNA2_120937_c0_seq1:132-563(-)
MASWDHAFWSQHCKREEKLFATAAQSQLVGEWHQDWLESSPGLMAIKGWPIQHLQGRLDGTMPPPSKPAKASQSRGASSSMNDPPRSARNPAVRTNFDYMTKSPTYKHNGEIFWFSQPSSRETRSAQMSARGAMAVKGSVPES